MELHNFQLPRATGRREPVFLALTGPRIPSAIPRKVGGLTHPLSAKPPREMAASLPPSNLSLKGCTLSVHREAGLDLNHVSQAEAMERIPCLIFFFSPPLKFDHIPNFSHTAWFPFLNGVKFISVIRELAWENHLSFKSYMF